MLDPHEGDHVRVTFEPPDRGWEDGTILGLAVWHNGNEHPLLAFVEFDVVPRRWWCDTRRMELHP